MSEGLSRRDLLRGGTLAAMLGLGGAAATVPASAAAGQTATIGVTELPDRLTPFRSGGGPVYDAVFDAGAVRDARSGALRPWLFGWEVDDGGVTLSLGTDRPTWTDGTALTAADVAFTMGYVTEESQTGRRRGQFADVDPAAVAGIEAVDERTVRLTFGTRPSRWTQLLTVPILPESVWAGIADPRQTVPDAPLTGSGPYAAASVNSERVKLSLRDAGHPTLTDPRDLVAEATLPDTDTPGPYVSTLVVRPGIDGATSARSAVRSGDVTAARPDRWDDTAVDDTTRVHPTWRSRHALSNTRRAPMDDPLFRQFLAQTWDASAHRDNRGAVAGEASAPVETATGVVEDFERTRSSFVTDGNVDVEAARSFLESGDGAYDYEFRRAKDVNVDTDDGRVLLVNGIHFSTYHTDNDDNRGEGRLEILVWPTDGMARSMERWAGVLREIGIPATTTRVNSSTFVDRVLQSQRFDVTELLVDFRPDGSRLVSLYGSSDVSETALGITGYDGADDALSRAVSATAPEAHRQALREAAARIYRDAPGFAFEHERTLTAVDDAWRGWVDDSIGAANRLSYHALRSDDTVLEPTATPTATAAQATATANRDVSTPEGDSGPDTSLLFGGVGALGALYVARRFVRGRGGDDPPEGARAAADADIDAPTGSEPAGAGASASGNAGPEDPEVASVFDDGDASSDGPPSDGTGDGSTGEGGTAADDSTGGDSTDGNEASADGAATRDRTDVGDTATDDGGTSADGDGTDGDETDDETRPTAEPDADVERFVGSASGLAAAHGTLGTDGRVVVYDATTDDGDRARVVAPDESVDADRYDEFERAGRQWSAFSTDDSVVSVLDVGTEPRPWIAVERYPGAPLATRLSDLDPEAVVDVVGDACQAVQGASLYNVRHLALTPERVYLERDADATNGKVDRWCLDAFLDTDGPTPFTAPEQLPDADETVGKPTDVYRLGAIAYTALCGEPPFDPDSESLAADIESGDYVSLADREDVDDAVASFSAVLDKALARYPDERYSSAHHLRTDLFGAL